MFQFPKNNIFLDGSFSFVLLYENKPVANIAFEPASGAILVNQIQGVPEVRKELYPIKWQTALLSVVYDWA